MSEAVLIKEVLQRDRKATAEFVSRYADKVYSYVRRRLLPRADLVDDLVQDVFLAAWQGLPDFRGEASLQNWLLGIARHKVEDHYRAKLREPMELPEDDDCVPETLQYPGWDESLDRERLFERARTVMRDLPEAYGVALLWRYWEKRSTAEIAERTGKTEKAAERLLARARESFKRRWNDEQPPV